MVLIPSVITVTYLGPPYFSLLIVLAIIIVMAEVFYATNKHFGWSLVAAIYITTAGYGLIELRGDSNTGFIRVFWLLFIIWSADIGAYITGRVIGGPKFAPHISPKKTWSGFCGALFFSGFAGATITYLVNFQSIWALTIMSISLGAISQYGDLLESWLKRRFDRKDMSNLIPGHGGLADRVDGLTAAAICAWIVNEISADFLIKWP